MTPEEKFNEVWSGLTARIDFKRYPNFVFLFKGDKCYFEFNLKNGNLWCSWDNVWTIFSDQYHMKHNEIQKFIKDQVEQHFNQREIRPHHESVVAMIQVEQHFNQREIRPRVIIPRQKAGVEQHFNQREIRPALRALPRVTSVEQHFNQREIRPNAVFTMDFLKVEQHFNQREITPMMNWLRQGLQVEQHFNKKTNG